MKKYREFCYNPLSWRVGKSEEKGSALLISLFCISLLMYMGAAFLSMSVNNYKMAKFNAGSVKVMWIAEAGVADAIHKIRENYFDKFLLGKLSAEETLLNIEEKLDKKIR